MVKALELTGKVFGKLTVVSKAPRTYGTMWNVQCACGATTVVATGNLVRGISTSCGCGRGTHKQSKTAVYRVWRAMHNRCRSEEPSLKPWYKDRGITVCPRWSKFENFIEDMGKRPPGGTLDRIDGNKGYTPQNCRWASMAQQNRNRSSTKLTEEKARAIRTDARYAVEIAKQYGVSSATVHAIKNGTKWK